MTTYQQTQFLYEIQNLEESIPEDRLQFLQERLKNNLYDFVLTKFLEQESSRDLKKSELARRIGYDPGRLNKLLATPGNWTLKTVSDLLAGISGEELVCASRTIGGGPKRNFTIDDQKEFNLSNDKNYRSKTGTSSDASVVSEVLVNIY